MLNASIGSLFGTIGQSLSTGYFCITGNIWSCGTVFFQSFGWLGLGILILAVGVVMYLLKPFSKWIMLIGIIIILLAIFAPAYLSGL